MQKTFRNLEISSLLIIFVAFLLEIFVSIYLIPGYINNLNNGTENVVDFVECIFAFLVLILHIICGAKCLIQLFKNTASVNDFTSTFISFAFLDSIINLAFGVIKVSTKLTPINEPVNLATIIVSSILLVLTFIAKFIKNDCKVLSLLVLIAFAVLSSIGFFEMSYDAIGNQLIPTIEFILPIIELTSIGLSICISSMLLLKSNSNE